MKGCVTAEWIGFHASGARGVFAPMLDREARKVRKPWCARITGLTSTGKFRYEFLDGSIDFGESNSEGSRGVRLTFYPESMQLYKMHEFTSWKSSRDWFFEVTEDGEIKEISEEEAKKWATNEDWVKTFTKRH